MTLQVFLKAQGPQLSAEFHALSEDEKAVLVSSFLEAKEEKQITPKNLSNISISKIVDFRIQYITSMVCLACCPNTVLTPL
jgi:hypothetical protein